MRWTPVPRPASPRPFPRCKEQTIPHAECVQKANEELLSSAAIAYSTASAFTVVGSFFVRSGRGCGLRTVVSGARFFV